VVQRPLDASCGPLLVDDDGSLIRARGIRYATAERFAAPVLAAPHTDVRDATRRGPVCPQLPSRLDFVNGPIVDGLERSEQCQVLSVTAPSGAQGLPVMVWFHGGAYMSGSGEAPKYDPDAPLLFGTPDRWADAPMLGPDPNPVDSEVARKTRGWWAAFARDGAAALGSSTLRI
jgi:hypothetical protein